MQLPRSPEFIVAEVSKNWPEESPGLLSERFEEVIETNRLRGYVLHTFALDRTPSPQGDALNETIIAVFRREESK